jgi:hypothetical protein
MMDFFEVILHLGLGTLVFADREMWGHRGTMWGLLAVLFGVWGFVAYLLFNHDTLLFTIEETITLMKGEKRTVMRKGRVLKMLRTPDEEGFFD